MITTSIIKKFTLILAVLLMAYISFELPWSSNVHMGKLKGFPSLLSLLVIIPAKLFFFLACILDFLNHPKARKISNISLSIAALPLALCLLAVPILFFATQDPLLQLGAGFALVVLVATPILTQLFPLLIFVPALIIDILWTRKERAIALQAIRTQNLEADQAKQRKGYRTSWVEPKDPND